MDKRNDTIDVLRGIAVLAVILGHSVQRGLVTGYDTTLLWKVIYSFHMPLFVILSGFTLYMSKPRYDLQWIKNKVFRLIIPLITWTVIAQLVNGFSFTGLQPHLSFSTTVIGFVKRSVVHPDWIFWFLWIIFVYMVIFLVVNKITDKIGLLKKYQIVIFAVVWGILYVLPDNFFGIGLIFYYFPIFVAGFYLSKYKDKFIRYWKFAAIPAAVMWVLIVNMRNAESSIWFKYGLAVVSMITVYSIVKLIERYIKWFAYLGKISLELYVCQIICLNIGISTGYIRVASIFVTATIISIALTKLLKTNWLTDLIAFGSVKKKPKQNIQITA